MGEMRQYRIGEYAKYLGVTPDLLKHYEDMGIIQSRRSESGYRYYPFHTTTRLIESIRLRNYGLTLREIKEILSDHSLNNEEVEALIDRHLRRLEEEVQLDEALLEESAAFRDWRQSLEDRDWDWEIRRSEERFFLPHTDRDNFLEDPRIYKILNSWMSYTPIVKSAMRVEESGQITWGFVVSARNLKRLGLPLNEAVEPIPARKVFYCKYRARVLRMTEEASERERHPAFQRLRALGLESEGSYYRTTVMPADWQQNSGYHYGCYTIPLREQD